MGTFTHPTPPASVVFHSASTGLPWAGGIVLTTIALRTALLPVVFGSMRNNTIIMNLRPEMELHSARMRQCQANGDSVGAVRGEVA
jgi:YidC/Oxa1 family membrane protein insertase